MLAFIPDRDFDAELDQERAAEAHRRSAIYTAEEMALALEAAHEEGRRQGRTEGEAAARAAAVQSAAERTLQALEAVTPAVAQLLAQADAHRATLEAQVMDFILSVFDRVLPELMRSQAAARAEAEARRAVGMAMGSARLVLRLPPEAAQAAGSDLTRRIRDAGFEGRVEIRAEPELAPGDVKAEWDNGFMDYSYAAICNQILGALNAAAPQRRAVRRDEKTEEGLHDR